MQAYDKDIIIIGGGPGGYVAAIRASQLGAKVLLIEKDKLGGTCLNRGCIPTKALNRNAEILNILKNSGAFGINIDNYSVDIAKMQERKNGIVSRLVSGVENLLKANKIDVLRAAASFIDKNTVRAYFPDGDTKQYTAKDIIIATGSIPSIPAIEGASDGGVYTSENILDFDRIPGSLGIIGGGVIGMELACIFNSLGTKVSVLEYLPNILGKTDSDITKRITVLFKRSGIGIDTSAKVKKIEKANERYTVYFEDKKGEKALAAEKVLIAAGREPNIDGLNLDAAGIDYNKKGIKVDGHYKTNIENIYAIGDVNGKAMLAHAASHQGMHAVEHIMGFNETANVVVPSCIFVFPEIASCGITEDEAKASGISYRTSKSMFGANGKALALGESDGFVKVISTDDKKNKGEDIIIGVHIMGPHASDLIHEGALAISNKLSINAIKNTIHAHPTLSEAFYEAALGLNGKAIHAIPSRR